MSNGSSFQELIGSLPTLRRAAYRSSAAGRTSGITSEMLKAEYALMEVLTEMLCGLSELYPFQHFDAEEPRSYFVSLSNKFHDWHLRCLEPSGDEAGGTMVSVLAARLTVNDLEKMVAEMVQALCLSRGGVADYDAWLADWESV
jgi:hypothetical protein